MPWAFASASATVSRNVAAPAGLIAMSEADFARYVQQAQNCLEEAGRATREVDKEAWLKLGEEWMEMARKAQREIAWSVGGTESA
jgi:hypothetical protein